MSGGRLLPHKRRKIILQKAKPSSKITDLLMPASIPSDVKKFIDKFGNIPISYIRVCRVPIPGAIEALANIVTLGGYETEKANREIDRFFHLFMLIGFSNGRRVIYEKNQRINIFETYKDIQPDQANCILVPSSHGINFREMVSKGIAMNGKNYFRYEMTTYNCQMFIYQNLYPWYISSIMDDTIKIWA